MKNDLIRAEQFIEEVKQLTAMPCFTIVPDFNRTPDIISSKLGGNPYWPKGSDYPEYEGVKMSLLAQINFSEINENDMLPKEGILQFFIATNSPCVYGVNFKNPDLQESFKIVYHPCIKKPITINGTKLEECDNSPLHCEVALNIEPALSFININDPEFNAIYKDVVARLFNDDNPGEILQFFNNEEMCAIEQALMFSPKPGHQILGWPKFTEGDPRNEEQQQQFNTTLLQLGSQFADEGELLMWGDMGTAQFFISHNNLKNLDFSSVFYLFTAS